jgi:hypothetical protein
LGIAGMNGVGDQANVSLAVKSRKWRFQLHRAASALPQEVDVAAFAGPRPGRLPACSRESGIQPGNLSSRRSLAPDLIAGGDEPNPAANH